MKLKYKKIILLTSLSTMGIGFLTLSMSQESLHAEKQINNTMQVESATFDSDDNNNSEESNAEMQAVRAMAALGTQSSTETSVTPASEASVTPTSASLPVYPLEEVKGMDELIEEFYAAKVACDVDKLKTLYDDPSKVESKEQLESMVQYIEQYRIEEYRNIKTYSKKSIEDGAYIVYAYHEIKFSDIDTLAPGLSKFYVVTDEKGNFKIASDINPDIEEYFDERNEDEDVQELIEMTNKKSEEAKASDENLRLFWSTLDELAQKSDDESTKNN